MSSFEDSFKFRRQLVDTPLSDGRTLGELTERGGLTLWWFAYCDFVEFLHPVGRILSDRMDGLYRIGACLDHVLYRLVDNSTGRMGTLAYNTMTKSSR